MRETDRSERHVIQCDNRYMSICHCQSHYVIMNYRPVNQNTSTNQPITVNHRENPVTCCLLIKVYLFNPIRWQLTPLMTVNSQWVVCVCECVCVCYLCKQWQRSSFSFLFIQVLLPRPGPPLYTHWTHMRTHTHTRARAHTYTHTHTHTHTGSSCELW